ncbi:MAG: YraN family protein [Candidatus Pseudobacter hemicellulosilyticus]|uniref:UPF0102 protein P0Y53_14920 n=1 Tax=Candidatus Pseudobacter hemicellulosilyticus TaxID=3121375 RepID=A0AAJ5WQA6_9BACT|nr:MAG: YraN family protein [Pseudobacter sp.]
MANHHDIGKKGETLATNWLQQQGYTILHQNWCYYHYEIDVIAAKKGILHFVEVKTRSSSYFGLPEESVSKKKISNMMKCADQYQYRHPQWTRIQYDILSILLAGEMPPQYFLIEDIYL